MMEDSKILAELNELKDKFNNIKTMLSEDITSISKQIQDKVDLPTYQYTDEENEIVNEIEDTIEYINNSISEFYKYEDDIPEDIKDNEIKETES